MILTCAASQVIPSVIQLIKSHPDYNISVVGVDNHTESESVGASFCDAFYQVPMGEEHGYMEKIEEIIQVEGIRVIFPGSDEETRTLAQAKEYLLSKYECHVTCSSSEVVKLASNKLEMLKS